MTHATSPVQDALDALAHAPDDLERLRAVCTTMLEDGRDEELLPYAATKAAIASFTNSLAAFAMQRGVRVNAVAPGPVWTPLIPSTMNEAKVRNFGQNTAFKRPAQPAEIAPLFVFLASAEASFVTGEVYGVTGGRTPI